LKSTRNNVVLRNNIINNSLQLHECSINGALMTSRWTD